VIPQFLITPNKTTQKTQKQSRSSEQRSPHLWVDLYRLQSEDLSEGSIKIQTQENLKFVDAGMSQMVTAPDVGPFRPDTDDSAILGDFLSRPVVIKQHNWTENSATVLQTTFNPWSAYFSDPVVKRKLDNYKLLRCKLHLKFVVNASPFYYGAMRVSYCPLATFQDNYVRPGDQIKLSQTPGLFLEPAVMTTSEMELPFLWPNAWLNVPQTGEFNNMGRVRYVQYAKLRSANGVSGSGVRITCYAWATDVELAGLTSTLSLQADEYEITGPISGPASAVANLASKLTKVPVIGELATATQIGASVVSTVARAFGYSNPPVIDDVSPMMPKAFHAFSSVDTSVPSDKLSLDPKNEVTVDNSVTGAGSEDPLVLSKWLQRESFLQGTLWQGSSTEGSILWSAPVTPNYAQSESVTGGAAISHTPAAYAARLFSFWRGGVTFRFRFIKTKYHTGRLSITWDPNGIPGADFETSTMTRVVDLQYEDEAVITVPYKQARAWLNNRMIYNNYSNGLSPTFTLDGNAQNGVIQVRVLNTLTGPAANPEIDILTFVSCASDIEMSNPNEIPINMSVWEIQSQDIVQDDVLSGMAKTAAAPSLEIVTVGEKISSLRTLLHRATLTDVVVAGNPRTDVSTFVGAGTVSSVNYFHRVPYGPGFFGQAQSWASKINSPGAAPYAFVPNHPANWILNCFSGYRGAFVHHFDVISGGVPIHNFAAERDQESPIIGDGTNQVRSGFSNLYDNTQNSNMARFSVTYNSGRARRAKGQRGMALTNCQTQSGLSIVDPQYSRWRFRVAFEPQRDLFPGVPTDNEQSSVRVDVVHHQDSAATTSSNWPNIYHYVSAGVDFNPVYFVCVPTIYEYALPPADNSWVPV